VLVIIEATGTPSCNGPTHSTEFLLIGFGIGNVKMDKNTKNQEIIGSLGEILSELDEMRQDVVAIKIAEAISDLSKIDSIGEGDQDL
jgi:hypothetical protein